MIRTLPLALLLLAAPAGAAERRFGVADFERVQVDGPYQVTLLTGLSSSARAEGSGGSLERLSIDVQGGTLRVRRNRSAWGGYPGEAPGPVKISLTTRTLRSASVIGSGSLDIDRAKGLRVDLSVAGSGRLSVAALDADNLIVGLLGAGRIALAGRARQLRASIQGSGDLAAASLRAEDAQIVSDTVGTVAVAVARTAKVTATGAGDVEIIGNPACTVDARGEGRVKCGRGR